MLAIKSRNGIFSLRLLLFARKLRLSDWFGVSSYNVFLGNTRNFLFIKYIRHTININLQQNDDELLSMAKSNTRNEIRRAIRDDYFFRETVSIPEFIVFYNKFAIEKGLAVISDSYCVKYGDSIFITGVEWNGYTVAMHANVYDREEKIVRLLYSASLRLSEHIEVNRIGIGNRYLHYRDFIYFRDMGATVYDFGGIYIGDKDKSQIGIAQFKRSFGGEDVTTLFIYSPIYYLLLFFKKLLRK